MADRAGEALRPDRRTRGMTGDRDGWQTKLTEGRARRRGPRRGRLCGTQAQCRRLWTSAIPTVMLGQHSNCLLLRAGYRDSEPVQKQLPRPLDDRRWQFAAANLTSPIRPAASQFLRHK
jgi:hypothetical protein